MSTHRVIDTFSFAMVQRSMNLGMVLDRCALTLVLFMWGVECRWCRNWSLVAAESFSGWVYNINCM